MWEIASPSPPRPNSFHKLFPVNDREYCASALSLPGVSSPESRRLRPPLRRGDGLGILNLSAFNNCVNLRNITHDFAFHLMPRREPSSRVKSCSSRSGRANILLLTSRRCSWGGKHRRRVHLLRNTRREKAD